ncbi:proline-rich protein 2-like, partial [Pyrgilauda ruficollis]|uniref:proline-rich protein 2-like n=1 Tax=Pyrgilauda ruficollis TaxID=221976 RepID=UPI001B862F53
RDLCGEGEADPGSPRRRVRPSRGCRAAETCGSTPGPQPAVSLPAPSFPIFPQSCHFQKLFGTDGELEDEDFLSAVEDAENQFVTPGHSSPSVVPVPPSKSHPSKAPTLRPLAGQGEHPLGFQGPPWRGAAPRDERDNALFLAACRELEGPEVPVGAGAAPVPPGRHEKPPWKCPGKENAQECAAPKKLRGGEEVVSGSGGLQDRQGPLPSAKPVLRPSTAGACTPRPPLSTGEPGSSRGSLPAPGAPCLRPVQAPLGRSSSSMPWTPPAQSCPQPRLPPRP